MPRFVLCLLILPNFQGVAITQMVVPGFKNFAVVVRNLLK
jgi:hypothetical protein